MKTKSLPSNRRLAAAIHFAESGPSGVHGGYLLTERKAEELGLIKKGSFKSRVKHRYPDAFCVKLDKPINSHKYIVWPGKIQSRGFEQPAIGLGKTAADAWKSVALKKRRKP